MSETDVRALMNRCFARGLTQVQLAELSGIERFQVTRFYRQDTTKLPLSPDKVRTLARALRAWEARQKK
jgi:hypothetical protein